MTVRGEVFPDAVRLRAAGAATRYDRVETLITVVNRGEQVLLLKKLCPLLSQMMVSSRVNGHMVCPSKSKYCAACLHGFPAGLQVRLPHTGGPLMTDR